MKIINLFAGFQNAYNEPGWQVSDRGMVLAVFYTRSAARLWAKTHSVKQ